MIIEETYIAGRVSEIVLFLKSAIISTSLKDEFNLENTYHIMMSAKILYEIISSEMIGTSKIRIDFYEDDEFVISYEH